MENEQGAARRVNGESSEKAIGTTQNDYICAYVYTYHLHTVAFGGFYEPVFAF